ncbi:MAG: hypothetical protein ACU841_04795, partial [Gammaproteobacteria bacterium]
MQCKENRPPPTGGDNIVKGSKEDQCANLSPGDDPRYTEDDLVGLWNTHSRAKLKISRLAPQSGAGDSIL